MANRRSWNRLSASVPMTLLELIRLSLSRRPRHWRPSSKRSSNLSFPFSLSFFLNFFSTILQYSSLYLFILLLVFMCLYELSSASKQQQQQDNFCHKGLIYLNRAKITTTNIKTIIQKDNIINTHTHKHNIFCSVLYLHLCIISISIYYINIKHIVCIYNCEFVWSTYSSYFPFRSSFNYLDLFSHLTNFCNYKTL